MVSSGNREERGTRGFIQNIYEQMLQLAIALFNRFRSRIPRVLLTVWILTPKEVRSRDLVAMQVILEVLERK